MPLGVAAAVLLSLAFLAGCQKDHVEKCVDDAIEGYATSYKDASPEDKAKTRFEARRLCMQAAGRKQ
jgi:hypothetical protein